MKKQIPRHQSPTSFQKNTSPKFKRAKPNTIQSPNGTDTNTIGTFQTYKNAGKKIHDQKHVFQNTTWTEHAPTSRNRSPELNATEQRIQFANGVS